jgi:hypothetical protein
MPRDESALGRHERIVILLVLLAGMAVRVATLTGPLDYPDWRQTENAYTAYRMWLEPVPEIMHPKVPYRGPADVHINEFPLHALCVALLYKIAGSESLLVARLFSVLCFAGAAIGVFRVVRRFLGRPTAWHAVVFYVSVPLSVFYSRAHHYDFMIMMLAFWFLDFALEFFETGRRRFFAGSLIFASLSFLMKAPYAFYLWLPLAVYVLGRPSRWSVPSRLALMAALGLVPVALTWLYNGYRIALDAPYPESVAYPMKFTPEFMRSFFFGTPGMRLEMDRWRVLLDRTLWITFTPVGALAALAALWVRPREGRGLGYWSAWTLALSPVVYVLVIFPMVASPHEYYSIPLVTTVAVLGALSTRRLAQRAPSRPAWPAALRLAAVWALLMVAGQYGMKQQNYFWVDWQRIEAGRLIREHTPPDAVVVSAMIGRSTGWSDPRLLYHARRRGWALYWNELNAENLELLKAHGATTLAVLVTPDYESAFKPEELLGTLPGERLELRRPFDQSPLGTLALFALPAPEHAAEGLRRCGAG